MTEMEKNEFPEMNETSNQDIIRLIKSIFGVESENLATYSPLTFAYIGDSIYALVAKTVIVEKTNCPAKELHKQTVKYVSAVAQAKIVRYFEDNNILTEEEFDMVRRGRNAKSASAAKNASIIDYRLATGLETLVGYLYMKGETVRMIEILKMGFDMLDNE